MEDKTPNFKRNTPFSILQDNIKCFTIILAHHTGLSNALYIYIYIDSPTGSG